MTQALRSYKTFPHIIQLRQEKEASKKEEMFHILLMGPGYDGKFVPEFMELKALFWSANIEFHVLDHNLQVLNALSNQSYYLPNLNDETKHTNTDWKQENLSNRLVMKGKRTVLEKEEMEEASKIILKVTSPKGADSSWMDFDSVAEKHKVKLYHMDFTAFSFPIEKYDIIFGMNSLWYLFNNPSFYDSIYPYFQKIIYSLRIGGMLFVDKICYGLIREYERHGIIGVKCENIGGFPNFIFKLTRVGK